MKFPQRQSHSPGPLLVSPFLLSLRSVIAADTCQPATWTEPGVARRAEATPTRSFKASRSVANVGSVQPGQINCRLWEATYDDVNYYTCTALADKFSITVDEFFMFNPEIDPDCGNIEPYTKYCVAAFIEPLRATDGLCGPLNNNATCLGTGLQCCNAETWTCGNSTEDCAPGTCYEGACAGDKVYSTDSTCGIAHGNRLCAGKWGDCCNSSGNCGTGDAFCGVGVCQVGNCTVQDDGEPDFPPENPFPWLSGNSTDGSCGGENRYSCNVAYGNCCSKDGRCGSFPLDCGVGCQPEFGECSTTTTSPSGCQTVSGIASPTPLSALCGAKGSSVAALGAGTIIGYAAGSSYVESLAACSAQCLATSCCTNIYFIQGKYCNLHYGPKSFIANVGNPQFDYYDAKCFTCGCD